MKNIFLFLLLPFQVFAAGNSKPLIIGITQDWDIVHPYLAMSFTPSLFLQFLMKPTVFPNKQLNLEASLIKNVPTYENGMASIGKDKKLSLRISIHEKAKWGDGVDVTCVDFEYARKVSTHPNIAVNDHELFSQLEAVTWEKKNEKECTLVFKAARTHYNNIRAFYPLSWHIDHEVFEKYANEPKGYEQHTPYLKDLKNPGLFYGPYIVEDFKISTSMTLKKNKYFYGQAPEIEQVIFKIIPNTNALEANLRSGEINFVPILGFSYDQALLLEKRFAQEKAEFSVDFEKDQNLEKLYLDIQNPATSDKRVRQALAHTINRPEINKALFGGKLEEAFHFLPSYDPNYTSDKNLVHLYDFDLKKAAILLDQAGWKLGPDGMRVKNGQKLKLGFSTVAGIQIRELAQEYFAAIWKKLGIETVIKNYPGRTLYGQILKCGDQPALIEGSDSNPLGEAPRAELHSSQIPKKANQCMGANFSHYSNPKMDQLLEQLDRELNLSKRKLLIGKMINIYTEDVPMIPLFFNMRNTVRPKNLAGQFEVGPLGYGFEYVETWNWK